MRVEKLIIAIPARLNSLRLPRKVLLDIDGTPMLKRVIDQCKQVKESSDVVVCTDSLEIKTLAETWGVEALITSEACSTGTDRIASVVNTLLSRAWGSRYEQQQLIDQETLKKTVIINVQADQPFVSPFLISDIYNGFNKYNLTSDILTPVYPLKTQDIHNPNLVKVVIAANGDALYFSRSAIPHVRGEEPATWQKFTKYYGHIGIYGFRASFLSTISQIPFSNLSKIEKLEQLRFLDSGIVIKTLQTPHEVESIDTCEDLREVISKMQKTQ